MSSTAIIDTLNYITTDLNIYLGLFILVTGIFGQVCNIIVFTTLKTFRETTCGYYLTIISIFNIGQSLPVFIRVLTSFHINSSSSIMFCKFRYFFGQYCALVSATCMCLTTLDQFLSMTKYRYLNNMKLASRYIILICILWFLHGIFTFIYYSSDQNSCIITNSSFAKYFAYVYVLILFVFLPMTIMIIFSLLAFFKIRTTASRQINNVRLGRDRQLTAMTLLHVLISVITTIPFGIFTAYILSIDTKDPKEIAWNKLINTIVTLFCFAGFASPFYMYCCVSKRFRKQIVHVVFNNDRHRRRILSNNQVVPHDIKQINQYPTIDRRSLNDIMIY